MYACLQQHATSGLTYVGNPGTVVTEEGPCKGVNTAECQSCCHQSSKQSCIHDCHFSHYRSALQAQDLMPAIGIAHLTDQSQGPCRY